MFARLFCAVCGRPDLQYTFLGTLPALQVATDEDMNELIMRNEEEFEKWQQMDQVRVPSVPLLSFLTGYLDQYSIPPRNGEPRFAATLSGVIGGPMAPNSFVGYGSCLGLRQQSRLVTCRGPVAGAGGGRGSSTALDTGMGGTVPRPPSWGVAQMSGR